MTTTYCSHGDVSGYLQIPAFTVSTAVTITNVEDRINENEDDIDKQTGHGWRTKTMTDEYHDLQHNYVIGRGLKIKLKHRIITDLLSGTDSLKLWNGSEWEEWLGTKTEGRDKDYWLDYTNGFLYIKTYYFQRESIVKITYRYGEGTVSKDLKKACILATSIDLLMMEDQSAIKSMGTEGINYASKIESMQKQLDNIIRHHKEIMVI